jgi:hypothetical protein
MKGVALSAMRSGAGTLSTIRPLTNTRSRSGALVMVTCCQTSGCSGMVRL